MQFFPNEFWKKVLVSAAYALIIAATLYLLFAFLLKYTLPFLMAFLIALYTRRIFYFFRKVKIPEKLCALIITAGVYLGPIGAAMLVMRRFFHQLSDIVEKIISNPDIIDQRLEGVLSFLESKYPKLAQTLSESQIISLITDKIGQLAFEIGENITLLAIKLPDLILFITVTVLSTYYFIISFDRMINLCKAKLPTVISCFFLAGKRHFLKCSKSYLLCTLIMLAITFCELVTGFYFLKIPYALSLALVISLVDMLPVFGVGTVLFPWAIICFAESNVLRGAGLLLLYLIITVVRQIAEPKILGKGMGIPPFITLASLYLGYLSGGVIGLVTAPFAVGVIYSVIAEAYSLTEAKTVDKS